MVGFRHPLRAGCGVGVSPGQEVMLGMRGYGSSAVSKGRETPWNGDMVGFGSGVTRPAVPESVRGRGSLGGPGHGDRAGDRQVPLGAFVFADPKRAMLPALVEEFLGGR